MSLFTKWILDTCSYHRNSSWSLYTASTLSRGSSKRYKSAVFRLRLWSTLNSLSLWACSHSQCRLNFSSRSLISNSQKDVSLSTLRSLSLKVSFSTLRKATLAKFELIYFNWSLVFLTEMSKGITKTGVRLERQKSVIAMGEEASSSNTRSGH